MKDELTVELCFETHETIMFELRIVMSMISLDRCVRY